MPDMKLSNPFLTAGYAGSEYFCDRKRETEELVQIGQKLQNAYGLTEENKSKYYRGMLMIEENRK